MKMIENVLVSDELKEKNFVCKLSACCGDCCVEGDAGAPLEEEEISILEDYSDQIMPYMTEKGKAEVKRIGVFDFDADGTFVTPLVNNRECAFVVVENGINFCSIEKAFTAGKIPFQKPLSCHLYPIRLSKVGDYTAVNYHKWSICNPALTNGDELGVPIYRFLKDPLIRKFGGEWYEKLRIAFEDEETE
jgi:hypothetical protein